MRFVSALSVCMLPVGVLACLAAPEKPVETAGADPDVQPALVAGGDDGLGPPHVFEPRRHPPHLAPLVSTPNLSAMPRLLTQQCFAVQRDEERKKSGTGIGFGRRPTSGHGAAQPVPPQPGKKPSASAPRRPAPQTPAPESPASASPAPAADSAANRGGHARQAEDESIASESSAPEPADHAGQEVAKDDSEIASVDRYHDWGASLYLSNDDSMSLSSAQRVLYAIDRFMPVPVEHIRPHELLNYFSFDTEPVAPHSDFSVNAQVQERPGEPGIFTLGLAISGRQLDVGTRRNTALSIVIDRSGSMSDEGRMDYLRHGLARMTDELKTGDLLNLVLFDHDVCVPLENFVVGRDSMDLLREVLARLVPRGSTDLHSGLKRGYELADKSYQQGFSNRVVMITDALANTGVTDEEMISMIGKYYDQRRIRLSGVGVGSDFNDSLLNRLTERGKGAYVFLGSQAEVDAVFGDRFVSLIETVANDVHFRLHLPPSLRMNVFYGEESSTVKEDVQAIHYFAGTSQLFLSDLMARNGELRGQDSIMLTIEYEDPEGGEARVEEFAFNLEEAARQTANVQKGRMVMSFVDGVYDLSRRSPDRVDYNEGGWVDPDAFQQCQLGRESLNQQRSGLESDPEVERVVSLWERYCSRYERPTAAVTRTPREGRDVWPGAR